jgi:hypothetical protein
MMNMVPEISNERIESSFQNKKKNKGEGKGKVKQRVSDRNKMLT